MFSLENRATTRNQVNFLILQFVFPQQGLVTSLRERMRAILIQNARLAEENQSLRRRLAAVEAVQQNNTNLSLQKTAICFCKAFGSIPFYFDQAEGLSKKDLLIIFGSATLVSVLCLRFLK